MNGFKKCDIGHFYKEDLSACPYCPGETGATDNSVGNEVIIDEGKKKTGTKLCARGKSAAKSKFDVYPSAYANGYAVQVCKGRMPGLDGKKHCSGSYC